MDTFLYCLLHIVSFTSTLLFFKHNILIDYFENSHYAPQLHSFPCLPRPAPVCDTPHRRRRRKKKEKEGGRRGTGRRKKRWRMKKKKSEICVTHIITEAWSKLPVTSPLKKMESLPQSHPCQMPSVVERYTSPSLTQFLGALFNDFLSRMLLCKAPQRNQDYWSTGHTLSKSPHVIMYSLCIIYYLKLAILAWKDGLVR